MNRQNYSIAMLLGTILLAFTACTNHSIDTTATDKSNTHKSSADSQHTNAAATDSLTKSKDELTKIYTRAIAECIKAAYQKDQTKFDTLYFGKHVYGQPDDFPDIELPQVIEQTQIRLVSPALGQRKQAERKSLVYINMMGWIEKEKAEFMFVVFTNGGEHQYDYFIQYTYNTSTNQYDLNSIAFENYLHLNGQEPKRTTIYKDGKYTVGK